MRLRKNSKAARSKSARKLAAGIPPSDYYEATRYSTSRSRLRSPVQSARFDVSAMTREQLLAKSRYFEKNDATLNILADLWEQYTVGSGLAVQPASSSPEWNMAAGAWWAEASTRLDVSTDQSLDSLLGVASRAWFIDGEGYMLTVRGERGWPGLQLIESHLVKTPKTLARDKGIIDGIRVAPKTLRPISYFIHSIQEDGGESFEEVSDDNVIRVWEPSRAGQLRGIPICHAVINELHDLSDLQLLEMKAVKDLARISKVIKTQEQEQDRQSLRASAVSTRTTLSSGATATISKTQYYTDVVGEEAVVMRPGDDYTQFASQRPSSSTHDYWKWLTTRVCLGCGIPYVLAYPDSMQGTVYRGAIDSAAAFFRLRSQVMQAVVKRVWVYVMGWARNAVPALRDAPYDWKNIRITPPRAPNVDIGYSADAMVKALSTATTSWGELYGDRGMDWRSQIDAYSEQLDYIKSKNIPLPGISPPTQAVQQPPNTEMKEEEPINA